MYVSCDETACVTLFQPSGFHCSIVMVFELLYPLLEHNDLIKGDVRKNIETLKRLMYNTLVPSDFDKNELEIAKTIVKRLTSKK